MGPVYYDSADVYIEKAADLLEKISRLDAIITALESTALKAAGTANIDEYMLNDGQTVIRTKYRDVQQVMAALMAFERLKQMYVNRLNGRAYRLVDGKNMTY
jgi:hypothetical protein